MRAMDRMDAKQWLACGGASKVLALVICAMVSLLAPRVALAAETSPMYRLYNPYNGDHMFTQNKNEYDNLCILGWSGENVAWRSPTKYGDTVYRVYNPNSGEHLFTTDEKEYNNLGRIGWKKEGSAFSSGGSKPIYRLYNKWLTAGTHIYTTDASEYAKLMQIGWSGEGVKLYCSDSEGLVGTWKGSLLSTRLSCPNSSSLVPTVTIKSISDTGEIVADATANYHNDFYWYYGTYPNHRDEYLTVTDKVSNARYEWGQELPISGYAAYDIYPLVANGATTYQGHTYFGIWLYVHDTPRDGLQVWTHVRSTPSYDDPGEWYRMTKQ